jgi:hypothetical protein
VEPASITPSPGPAVGGLVELPTGGGSDGGSGGLATALVLLAIAVTTVLMGGVWRLSRRSRG